MWFWICVSSLVRTERPGWPGSSDADDPFAVLVLVCDKKKKRGHRRYDALVHEVDLPSSLGAPAALRRRRPRPPSSGGAQPGAGLSVAPCLGLKWARLGLRSHALCATRAEGAGEGECDALCDDDYEFKPSSLRDGPEQPSLKRLRSYLSFLSTDASALSSGTASCACPRLDLATDTAQSRGRSSTVRQSWSRR